MFRSFRRFRIRRSRSSGSPPPPRWPGSSRWSPPVRRRVGRQAAGVVVAALAFTGCDLYGNGPVTDYDRRSPAAVAPEPPAGSDVEQVRLYIGEVPADVRCLKLTAEGQGRTVVRELEVMGGGSLTESLSGLPIGIVTFTGEAFTTACSAVSKSSIGAWASAPVQASIVLGRLSTVELVMVRNGRAKVSVTFTEEAACTAVGAACRINSECCSKKCTLGLCAVPDGGAE